MVLAVGCGKSEEAKPAVPARAAAQPPPVARSLPAPAAPPPAMEPREAATEISAQELLAEYKANEIRADAKFRGKALRVLGRIDSVTKDVLGNPLVALDTRDGWTPVIANFKDESALAALMKGQAIAVRCRGAGANVMKSPTLNDCELDTEASANPDAFIPDPGKSQVVTLDLEGKDPPEDQALWINAALAIRNHCRTERIEGDRLGDLWNTAQLTVQRRGGVFRVRATFDDRRKLVHKGRAPVFEVDISKGRIRAADSSARALCKL